jgi:hypothetical protein
MGIAQMWMRIKQFIKSFTTNPVGLTLFFSHILLFIYVIIDKLQQPATGRDVSWEELYQEGSAHSLIAGRIFHWAYESALMQVITLIDMPSLILADLTTAVFPSQLYSQSSAYTASWILVGMWLIYSSLQWLLAGYCVKRYLEIRKEL